MNHKGEGQRHIAPKDKGQRHIAPKDKGQRHIAPKDKGQRHIASKDEGQSHIAPKGRRPCHMAPNKNKPCDMVCKRLDIIQVNLHKAKLATVELTKLFLDADFNGQGQGGKVNADKPGVILVQEPYVQYNGKVFNEGWNAVHHNRGRAAILLNNGVNHWPVQKFTSRDCVVTTIKLTNSNNEAKTLYLACLSRHIETSCIRGVESNSRTLQKQRCTPNYWHGQQCPQS